MSNLSDLLPSGAGGKSFDFVASGTLPNGRTVALRSDGKVEALAGTPAVLSNEVTFESGTTDMTACCYDPSKDKIFVAYVDAANSEYGTMVVGTISSGTVSFGTPVVFNSSNTQYVACTFYAGSINKPYISYSASTIGRSNVINISGTTPTAGSQSTFPSNQNGSHFACCYDSTADRAITVFMRGSSPYYGLAVAASVTGTGAPVFGSILTFNSGTSQEMSVAYDENANKSVVVYQGQSSQGNANVLTLSGSTISAGSQTTFNAAGTNNPRIAYDPDNQKLIIAYKDAGNSSYGAAVIGTISGTSISFSAEQVFNANSTDWCSLAYDTINNKMMLGYRDYGNSSKLTVREITSSGSTLTFGTTFTNNSSSIDYTSSAFDPDTGTTFFAYKENSGKAAVFSPATGNDIASFVGITEAAISNAATGTVTLQGGINTTAITNTATTTFAITVANPGSGNRYYIDGALQATVSLSEGRTYKFDQSNGTNGGHPLRFSTTSDGTHGGGTEYTTGVTVVGVPGNAGAYTQIVVAIGAPTLYYYCTAHSGMGGTANTPDDARFTVGSTYYVQNDGTLGTGSTSIVAGEALSASSINLVNT